jgi:hypothetical protein
MVLYPQAIIKPVGAALAVPNTILRSSPAEAWDIANPGALPMLKGHSLHLNSELGGYVLHAWVWKNNPEGMYEDWNPQVTCP